MEGQGGYCGGGASSTFDVLLKRGRGTMVCVSRGTTRQDLHTEDWTQEKPALLTPWSWTSGPQHVKRWMSVSPATQSVVPCYGNPQKKKKQGILEEMDYELLELSEIDNFTVSWIQSILREMSPCSLTVFFSSFPQNQVSFKSIRFWNRHKRSKKVWVIWNRYFNF